MVPLKDKLSFSKDVLCFSFPLNKQTKKIRLLNRLRWLFRWFLISYGETGFQPGVLLHSKCSLLIRVDSKPTHTGMCRKFHECVAWFKKIMSCGADGKRMVEWTVEWWKLSNSTVAYWPVNCSSYLYLPWLFRLQITNWFVHNCLFSSSPTITLSYKRCCLWTIIQLSLKSYNIKKLIMPEEEYIYKWKYFSSFYSMWRDLL